MAFIFPFTELTYYFGAKFCLNADSLPLRALYFHQLLPLVKFYQNNVYLIFIVMIVVFLNAASGKLPLTKYTRFNIIQAILLDIICSCLGSIYTFLPIIVRESIFGAAFINFFYLGMVLLILYCCFMIIYYRYPKIPIISEAAKLQIQRGYIE